MISTGTAACHVYSTDGIDELLAWGRAHGFPGAWHQDSRGFLGFIPACGAPAETKWKECA